MTSHRCSPHRGQTVTPSSVLNLTQPQYLVATAPRGPARPAQGVQGLTPRTNFVPAPVANGHGAVRILARNGHAAPPAGAPTGNYQAAAQGDVAQAYAAPPAPSQAAALHATLVHGRHDYSAVPPPPQLQARGGGPRRGGALPMHPTRGRVASASANGVRATVEPAAPMPGSAAARGRGRGRGGRGGGAGANGHAVVAA